MDDENLDFSMEEADELYSMQIGTAVDLDNLTKAIQENNRHIKNLININDFAKVTLYTGQETLSISTEFKTINLPLSSCAWDYREIQIVLLIIAANNFLHTLKISSVMDVKEYNAYVRFDNDQKMMNVKFSEDGMTLICEYKKLISTVTGFRILSIKGVV